MLLERFYDDKLAQASYLIGCQATGEAIVVDPNRDIEQYLDAAGREGLAITHVTETHIHADFVSGSRELAERTGAALLLSAEGGSDWQYAFAVQAGASLLEDGDDFSVGNIRFEARHTPGHTPEHLALLVTDTAATDIPMGAFTGDFLFVGDVGRPDLLERAAKVADTMEAAARDLFRSLQRFASLPDHLQIWPAHGAGSACGKALGAVPSSTLGYERVANWAFNVKDEDRFVELVLEGQPEPPRYFAEMKRVNRDGPRILHGLPRPERIESHRLDDLLRQHAIVVDTRHSADFAEGHVPGTINIPLNRSFTTWAGWLIPFDRDCYLITGHADDALEAARDLAMIGLDRVAGFFGDDVVEAWRRAHGPLATTAQVSADELDLPPDNGVALVDVRDPGEWEAGHIPGVANIPLGYLTDRLDELPRDGRLVLHCQGGGRSAIGASLLQAHGFRNVSNLVGGFDAWARAGRPVARDASRA